MADIQSIADQFIQFYYQTFDTNRSGLASLYRPTSMLTFEGAQTLGAQDITEKLVGLPFQKVAHKINTKDFQPNGNGILISITGILLTDDEANPLNFSQTFTLQADGASYYVQNDIFRLVYGI